MLKAAFDEYVKLCDNRARTFEEESGKKLIQSKLEFQLGHQK